MCFRNRKEMAEVAINIARHWKFQKFVKSRQKFSPKLNFTFQLDSVPTDFQSTADSYKTACNGPALVFLGTYIPDDSKAAYTSLASRSPTESGQ